MGACGGFANARIIGDKRSFAGGAIEKKVHRGLLEKHFVLNLAAAVPSGKYFALEILNLTRSRFTLTCSH
jgi:hypothetical protein